MQMIFSLRNGNVVVDSTQSLDDFSAAFAAQCKLKKTHVKSTLSKGLGYPHIKALESVLTPLKASGDTSISLPVTCTDALRELRVWLEDNIDMGTPLYFDSAGEMDSTALYEALSPLFANVTTAPAPQVVPENHPGWVASRAHDITTRRDAILRDEAAHARDNAQLDADESLSVTHYHDTQDAVEALNRQVFTHADYGQALALLEQAGLHDFAATLKEMTETKIAEDYMAHNT